MYITKHSVNRNWQFTRASEKTMCQVSYLFEHATLPYVNILSSPEGLLSS